MKRLLTMVMCVFFLATSVMASASAKDVYVTKKGKKYHVEECRWIKNRETIKMSEKKALEEGYKPCVCIKKEESQKENKKEKNS